MDGSGKESFHFLLHFACKNTATTFLTSDWLHTGLTRQFQSSLKNTAQRENDLAIAAISLLPVLVLVVFVFTCIVYIEREYMQLQQLT